MKIVFFGYNTIMLCEWIFVDRAPCKILFPLLLGRLFTKTWKAQRNPIKNPYASPIQKNTITSVNHFSNKNIYVRIENPQISSASSIQNPQAKISSGLSKKKKRNEMIIIVLIAESSGGSNKWIFLQSSYKQFHSSFFLKKSRNKLFSLSPFFLLKKTKIISTVGQQDVFISFLLY